jgi:hypothetical protein
MEQRAGLRDGSAKAASGLPGALAGPSKPHPFAGKTFGTPFSKGMSGRLQAKARRKALQDEQIAQWLQGRELTAAERSLIRVAADLATRPLPRDPELAVRVSRDISRILQTLGLVHQRVPVVVEEPEPIDADVAGMFESNAVRPKPNSKRKR